MKTLTSAKQVIRLLICFNIVTILASVTIISSGMFVANAKGSKASCPPIGLRGNNITLTSTKYSGQFLNTAEPPEILANITLTFTTDPTSHNLTQADFTDTPAPQTPKEGVPIALANGTLDTTVNQQRLSSFVVDTKDRANAVKIAFIAGNVVGNKIGGIWEIRDPNGQYDGFFGRWLVTAS